MMSSDMPEPSTNQSTAKVLFNFTPGVPAELELLAGDFVEVEKIVDDFWYFGTNLKDGTQGQFPKDFVTFIQLPTTKPSEKLLFALDSFFPETSEDLPFEKGDIIVMESKIDESWVMGRCNNQRGMFPLNYTMEFRKSTKLKSRNEVLSQVQATMSLTAQLDNELSFKAGEIIDVCKYVDDAWAEGRIGDRTGVFPLSFTTKISINSERKNSEISSKKKNSVKNDRKVDEISSTLQRTGDKSWKVEPAVGGVVEVASSGVQQQRCLQQDNDKLFSGGVVGSSVEQRSEINGGKAKDPIVTEGDSVVAKFSYQRRNSNELSFKEGDNIEVIERTSDMWLYGKINNNFGYIPRSYVADRLVSLAKKLESDAAIMDAGVEEKEKAKQCISKAITGRHEVDIRLVVCDFVATTDFEVSVNIGETVHVLKVNGEWCDVKDHFGKTGFVPTECLQQVVAKNIKEKYSPVTYTVANIAPSSNRNQVSTNPEPPAFDSGTYRVKKRRDSQPQMQNNQPEQNKSSLSGAVQPMKGISRSNPVGSKPRQKYKHSNSLTALNPSPGNEGKTVSRKSEYSKPNRSASHIQRSYSLREHKIPHSSSAGELSTSSSPIFHRNTPRYISSSSRSDTNSTCSSDSTKSAPTPTQPTVPPHRGKPSKKLHQEIILSFDPLASDEKPPDLPVRTTSNKRATRAAPPPPTKSPAANVSTDVSPKRNMSPPKRPPQPRVKSKKNNQPQISPQQKQRIEKIRSEIEEYCRMRKDLENLYNGTLDGKERMEISENKQFVNSKLTRLQKELHEIVSGDHLYESVDQYLKPEVEPEAEYESIARAPTPPPIEQVEDLKRKRSTKRKHVVCEIIKTEEDFLQDITIAIIDIMEPLIDRELPPDIRIDILFGNITDVKAFSEEFLAALKAIPNPPTGEQNIGKVFSRFSPQMKEVYKVYCRNHDDATSLLEKYEEDQEFQVPLQECLKNAKEKVNTFDLGSFLIKPVQRMLKYPLLLQELLKLTDHGDSEGDASYRDLINAVKLMQKAANEINEDKRKKDLVRKYRRGSQETKLTGKISRLTIHSVKKKTARMSRRIGHVTGIGQPETVDERFNAVEKRFKELEKCVKEFLLNIENICTKFRDELAGELLLAEDIYDYYSSDHTRGVKCYTTTSRKISEQLYRQFHDQIQLNTASPLSSFLVRCKGPQALIEKRFDKLLDYELCQRNSDSKEKIQMAMNVYEALNQQLLDELPILCKLGARLLQTCISTFITLQVKLQRKILKELHSVHYMLENDCETLEGKPDLASLDSTSLMEEFNHEHNQVVFDVSRFLIVPGSFGALISTKSNEEHRRRSSVRSTTSIPSIPIQTQQQRDHVTTKHPPPSIHVCTSPHHPTQKVELAVNTGDIVGVMKTQDPMGNTQRWFVDNGASQGFLPCSILHPYTPNHLTPNSPTTPRHMNPTFTPEQTPSPKPRRRTVSPTPSSSSADIGVYKQTSAGFEASNPRQEIGVYSQISTGFEASSPRQRSSPSPSRGSSVYHLRESASQGELPDDVLTEVFEEEEEMMDESEYGDVTHANCDVNKEYYRVEYSFIARNKLELTTEAGEMLGLLVPHDLENNNEWWLMSSASGQQGYVPANYLTKAEYL
nr:dynamin-binding protein-like [Ciona intestinalis]|eukprot:XP_009861636.1 dynamin-binding protein-like [Ciona intestinalis]